IGRLYGDSRPKLLTVKLSTYDRTGHVKNYFLAASLAASTAAPAAAPASLAASTAVAAEPAAAEAASVAAAAAAGASAGAGAGTTTTAGAGAGASSFLPQAARATAATIAAKTRDLFIFTILDELRKQFPEIAKRNLNQNSSYVLTGERTRALSTQL
ncbi:MAG: hypothetical protein WAW46_03730, partial [Polaromonas sp.]